MNIKRIILIAVLVVAALALVKAAPLAWLFTAGLRAPVVAPEPDYWPTSGWHLSTPEEQGLDSTKLAEGILSMQANQVKVDSLLMVRNGYVVLDAHFAPYDGKFPHDIASTTKSVMTTLIAIASEQGKLDLDQPVLSFFPDRTILNLDERKARLTVRDLASMRGGMEVDCQDDEGTLDAMRSTPDWIQAALDRRMVYEPGTRFCYDSPGMHLLSAILQQATGMKAFEFAQQYLFSPLGIRSAIWETDPQGYTRGWGDLHLLPEDMAKFGYLWLHRGSWDGQQIVSEAWVVDSVRTHSKFVEPDFGYGYGWWITPGDYQAAGRGGQRIRVIASKNTMVVVTASADDYSAIAAWLTPLLIPANNPLPANPEGTAALQAALTAVERSDDELSDGNIPETASLVSGKTYLCESNPADVETFRMVFDEPGQATLYAKIGGADQTWPIGLDGNYRMSDLGTGFRGSWVDEHTFQFVVFNIGVVSRTMVFDDSTLQVTAPEANITIACQVQNP
jgi:CubicO group peptidase (beta-lactamase class C family)